MIERSFLNYSANAFYVLQPVGSVISFVILPMAIVFPCASVSEISASRDA